MVVFEVEEEPLTARGRGQGRMERDTGAEMQYSDEGWLRYRQWTT